MNQHEKHFPWIIDPISPSEEIPPLPLFNFEQPNLPDFLEPAHPDLGIDVNWIIKILYT